MSEFRMPSLGADMERGVVIEWLVKPGDAVRRGDVVAVVETPKSTVEVECFETGTIRQLLVDEGQTVPVGTALAVLDDARPAPVAPGSPAAAKAARPLEVALAPAPPIERVVTVPGPATPAARVPAAVAPPPRVTAGTVSPLPVRRPRISPLANRLAAEAGIDLSRLHGTGFRGAIRADDVRHARERMRAQPAVAAEPEPPAAGDILSRGPAERAADMRRSIAELMTRSNREIPHYHLTLTVDLQRSVLWMKERNRELDMSERLVPAALLLKAAARAARSVRELNGHWEDGGFRPMEQVDLGLVLSLRSGGLLVPAIAGADRITVDEMMARIRELTRRARSGRLRGSDLVPPTITVSNLGDQGAESVLGVIYPPQVALVGFGAVADRPWAVDRMIGVRPLVTVTLAGDHRATDGATGSRFLKTIDTLLQSPEEL